MRSSIEATTTLLYLGSSLSRCFYKLSTYLPFYKKIDKEIIFYNGFLVILIILLHYLHIFRIRIKEMWIK